MRLRKVILGLDPTTLLPSEEPKMAQDGSSGGRLRGIGMSEDCVGSLEAVTRTLELGQVEQNKSQAVEARRDLGGVKPPLSFGQVDLLLKEWLRRLQLSTIPQEAPYLAEERQPSGGYDPK